MGQQELIWFFAIFHHEFRKNNPIAFEVLMVLAIAHLFGFYNPKQLADFLDLPHQKFYAELKDWSVYHVKKADLLIFMLTQLKAEFHREGIDITQLPLTLDSGYVSQELRVRLHR